MILIKIDRNSVRVFSGTDAVKPYYSFNYIWVPAECNSCKQKVTINQIDYDNGYSICPHCHGEGTFDDFELEDIHQVAKEMGIV